jgi:hypothetical protein
MVFYVTRDWTCSGSQHLEQEEGRIKRRKGEKKGKNKSSERLKKEKRRKNERKKDRKLPVS